MQMKVHACIYTYGFKRTLLCANDGDLFDFCALAQNCLATCFRVFTCYTCIHISLGYTSFYLHDYSMVSLASFLLMGI